MILSIAVKFIGGDPVRSVSNLFFSPKHEGAEKGHAERSQLRSCHRINRGWHASGGDC